MPSRGSGLAVAVASTTLSPKRTTAAPWACLASFPVSMESCFPPVSSTDTLVTSGFIGHPFYGAEVGQKGMRQGMESAWTGVGQGPRLGKRTVHRLTGPENQGPEIKVQRPKSGTGPTRSRSRCYLRMPSLEITVLYRSESYFFR